MHRLGSRAKLPLAGLTVQWWIQHIARATPDWGRPDTIRSPSPGRCGTTPKWEFEDTMCAACTPLASLLCWQWSQRNIRRLRAEAAGFARWCHPSNWRVSPGVWSMNWFSLLIEVVSSSTISARRNRRLLGSVFCRQDGMIEQHCSANVSRAPIGRSKAHCECVCSLTVLFASPSGYTSAMEDEMLNQQLRLDSGGLISAIFWPFTMALYPTTPVELTSH